MDKNLLSRILTGEASKDEKEEFYRSLGDDKKEEELFYEVKSLWLRTSHPETTLTLESEFEMLWEKVNHNEKNNSFSIGKRILQYAAIIVFILGIGAVAGYFLSGYNHSEFADTGIQKYTATKGSVSTVEFADGTKIWLNSGSELTYREDYKTKQRIAELHGEAFFEVKHRADFPLMIKVKQVIIRDLGTTFNIKAYPEDKFVETSLVEGKADILSSAGNPLVELKPGENAVYNSEDKKIEIKAFRSNVLSAWRDGKFVIRDQRLEDICKEISRWYDVKFIFENQDLKNYRYTGNIKKTTTALGVLKMLKITTNLKYRIKEEPDQADEIIIY